MDIFDDTIVDIINWFDGKRKSGLSRLFQFPQANDPDLPLHERVAGERVPAGIILKEDTQLELGHPSVGSCCATLATHDMELVHDGRITLVGPDVSESNEERLPFAQIIIAAVKGQTAGDGDPSPDATAVIDQTASLMDRVAHTAAQTEGYMIRSVPNLIWARVSKDAARQGFSLKELGERLIRALRQNCEDITRCEIYFVTSGKMDVERLDDIIEAARVKKRKLEDFKLGADGRYECTREQDCGVCPEQVVCDNIRDVIKIRKGDRLISFKNDPNADM